MVVDAVSCELVSDGISRLNREETGKKQGNFAKLACFRLLCTAKTLVFPAFLAEFPAQWNREFWGRIREFEIGNR